MKGHTHKAQTVITAMKDKNIQEEKITTTIIFFYSRRYLLLNDLTASEGIGERCWPKGIKLRLFRMD